MRSVPHRVVCLLGLDDGVFPRKSPRDGDDLMLDDPHVGDRDARTEDRQLLLDALLAATDHLIVTYTGNDERTNLAAAGGAGRRAARRDRPHGPHRRGTGARAGRIRHPLQPFDPRNFMAGELVPERAWSFDSVDARRGAGADGRARRAPPFLAGPLPAATAPLVELDDLVRFVQHPVRAFLRQRLGISVGDYSDEVEDALPVELDALERWGVGAAAARGRLAGASIEACVAAEIARGTLPPGLLAEPVIAKVRPIVAHIAAAANTCSTTDAEPASVDVKVALADGRTLSGTVPGVDGDVAANRHLLARQRRGTASPRGSAARADRRAPRARRSRRSRSGARGPARPTARPITSPAIPPLADHAGVREERRSRSSRRSSTSTTAGCASRSRSPARPRPRTPQPRSPAATPDGRRARRGSRPGASPRRTPSPSTSSCSAASARFDELLAEPPRADEQGEGWDATRRRASAATRAGCGTACSPTKRHRAVTGITDIEAVRRLRAAADGRDRARGERRHRQDVSRSPRSPRATSPRARRSSSCCSSPSRAWRPASCASACASGWSAPSRRSTARWRATRRRRGRSRCSPRARRERSTQRRETPRARARRLRRRDDRHHARLLPGGARRPRRRRRRRARRRLRRGRQDLVEEVVDDLYVRRFHGRDVAAVRPRRRPCGSPGSRSTTPPRASSPRTRPRSTVEAMRRRLALAVREELDARKRQMAVMTYDDLLTRLDDTLTGAGGAAAAARAARALPRRARRRVPGHRSRSSGTSCAARSARAA